MHEVATATDVIFTALEAAQWTGGTWQGPHPTIIAGIYTDTRKTVLGAMYIAIKGVNFDGHTFVAQAIAAGACAVLVDVDAKVSSNLPSLCVPNTQKALYDLAAGWRNKVAPRIVGVTGSAGKTTVKEWTAHLLSSVGKTARTCGNWNNDLGLPKSILAMPGDTEFGVFEAGTNHPGEIRHLAELMKPDCAIITNVGPVHIEFFGCEHAIADEKAELLRALPADGVAVLDADSPHFAYLSQQAPCRVVTVSLKTDSDFLAIRYDTDAGWFTVLDRVTGEEHEIFTGQPGVHQVVNALEALAMAREFGVSWEAITEQLGTVPRMPMRWERMDRDGLVWINDTYNANPLSMVKSVETFAALDSGGGKKIAILGDMFELGDYDELMHRKIGSLVASLPIDMLLAVGEMSSKWMALAALEAGMKPENVFRASDSTTAKKAAATLLKPGMFVLLKASHGMALERILT